MIFFILFLNVVFLYAKKLEVIYNYIGKGDFPPKNFLITTDENSIIRTVETNGKIVGNLNRKVGVFELDNNNNSIINIETNIKDRRIKIRKGKETIDNFIVSDKNIIQTSSDIFMTFDGNSSFYENKRNDQNHHVFYSYKNNTLNGSLYNLDSLGTKSHYFSIGKKIYVYSTECVSPMGKPEIWDLAGCTAVITMPVELHSDDMLVNVLNRYILENIDQDLLEVLYPFIFLKVPITEDKNIWNYAADSALKEGTIFYGASNLSNIKGLPWVSANGYGIGDKIYIDFKGKAPKTILFLNGYISEEKQYLFMQNSRVKKINLINPANNATQTYLFYSGTSREINQIDISNIYKDDTNESLIIEMSEIYPGTKYKDLCIQAIIPDFSYTEF